LVASARNLGQWDGMKRCLWILIPSAIVAGQSTEGSFAERSPEPTEACDSVAVDNLVGRARSAVTEPLAAANLLREAFEACPERADLLRGSISALVGAREFEAAILTANEYLAGSPDSIPILAAKANAEFMDQRFEAATETAGRALELDPDNAPALKVYGNALYLSGDSSGAVNALLRLLDRYPDDHDGAYMLGRIYYQENRFSLAAAQFQKVIKLDPRSYKAYDNLGLCHEALGDKDEAVRNFLAAIELVETKEPQYDWPYANLANLLIDTNDLQRGFEAASKAASRNPQSARNFFLAGKALVRQGKFHQSLRWLERSSALDPTYAQPLYWLSRVYTRLGDVSKAKRALADFQAAKAKEPDERR